MAVPLLRPSVAFLALALLGCTANPELPTEPLLPESYLAQAPAGLEPEVFAPGLASTGEHEFGSVFSADGLEYYYGVDVGGRTEIRSMVFGEEEWSSPQVVLQDATYSYNDPFLSPGGERLYFISDQPPLRSRDVSGKAEDTDIWFCERGPEGEGWLKPRNAGPKVNTDANEYYVSLTDAGDLYFASNRAAKSERPHDFDLYVSRLVAGEYQQPTPLPGEVNTRDYEADVFVAPDESFVIFSSARAEGLGKGDLYISFRGDNQQWSAARNLGSPINGPGHELCPFVTADGEFFFYTSEGNIHWVRTSALDLP